jgi:hypothetical protein
VEGNGSEQDNANKRRYGMTTQTLGFFLATALGLALIPGYIARFFTAMQPMTPQRDRRTV